MHNNNQHQTQTSRVTGNNSQILLEYDYTSLKTPTINTHQCRVCVTKFKLVIDLC